MPFPPARRRFGRATALLLTPLLAVALTSCTTKAGTGDTGGDTAPRAGGTLTVALAVEVTTLDPSKGSANAMALVGSSIYDTLMVVPKLGDQPQPNLAKSLTASPDKLTWTMTLPTGVQFSDGTPFNAEAVKFNLERGMAKGSTAAALLSSVKSVEAPDETTVLLRLKEPFASLPYAFAYDGSGTAGYIASPTALKQHGDDYTAHAAGVGPFKLKSWSPGKPVELVRNPNYWNKDRQVYLDQVVIKTIADPQSAYQALQAGDIDLMSTVNPTLMQTAKADSQVNFVQGVGGDQDAVILNLAQPPFDDLRLRQAVSKALNRQEIVDLTTEGFGKPAVSLFPEGNAFHSTAADPGFDLAGAKALVKEYETATGRKATFSYTCNTIRPATDVIVAQLKAAGFDVKLDALDYSAWVAAFFGKKYQAICWTMAGFLTPDLLPYRFLYSGGDLNTGGFTDATFDARVTAARAESDPAKRKQLWNEADTVLTTQLPWVWTTSAPIGFIWSKRMHSADYDEPSRLRYSVPTFANAWVTN
ncbi:ABC transporter substrate-binding protein [Micromonospora haikouensis]|uniref:ABC transporter substrate-binding protein n=1 Tax=Micromonospora haikouensis TaxID=686309 RepID=UPI00368EABF1